MAEELKFGIIGCGGIGMLHAAALEEVAGARLIAVADSNPRQRSAVQPGVRFFADYHELLDADVDAVIICTPTASHCQLSIAALSQGKHVLVEKPMAVNVSDARSMCERAREAGRVLFIGMTHRFYPELREAKRLVDDGEIGDVLMIRDTIVEPLGFIGLPSWYLDKDFAGGGVVTTDGIHLVDRVCWFARVEPSAVTGAVGYRSLQASVEDSGQMFLWFRNGIAAQLTMTYMNTDHSLVCDLEVIGSKGSLIVHTWKGYAVEGISGSRERIFYRDEPHALKVRIGLKAEIEEFCSAIKAQRCPWPSPEDSLKALEVVRAFYEAAGSGVIMPLG